MSFELRLIRLRSHHEVAGALDCVAGGSSSESTRLVDSALSGLTGEFSRRNPSSLVEGWRQELVATSGRTGPGAARILSSPCIATQCVVNYQWTWPFVDDEGSRAERSPSWVEIARARDPVFAELMSPKYPFFELFLFGFHRRAERWPINGSGVLLHRSELAELRDIVRLLRVRFVDAESDCWVAGDLAAMALADEDLTLLLSEG